MCSPRRWRALCVLPEASDQVSTSALPFNLVIVFRYMTSFSCCLPANPSKCPFVLGKCLWVRMNWWVGEKLPVCAPFCVASHISPAGADASASASEVFPEALKRTLSQGVPIFSYNSFPPSFFPSFLFFSFSLSLFRKSPLQVRKVFCHIRDGGIRNGKLGSAKIHTSFCFTWFAPTARMQWLKVVQVGMALSVSCFVWLATLNGWVRALGWAEEAEIHILADWAVWPGARLLLHKGRGFT